MDELIAFARAMLDEDEAAAKAAQDIEWDWRDLGKPFGERPSIAHTVHIARHDPARVLREVEAKRVILARYEFARNQVAAGVLNEDAGYGPADAGWPLRADSHELDVRSLAAAWSDHPGYRQEWQP